MDGDILTNEEKLKFIKANYKSTRTWELMPKEEKDLFYKEWINCLANIIPINLYKYRECNDNNISALRNKKAWFSNPSTWNDPIDVTAQYNLKKDLKILDENFDDYVLKFALRFINQYIDSFCAQKKFVEQDTVKKVYYSVFKGNDSFDPNKMITYLTPIVGDIQARQITAKTQEIFIKVFNPEFKKNITNVFEKFLVFNDIKNKFIMFSLSETYTNNHQWAMYANNGKGFCIGYEIIPKNLREASLLPELLPIYYGEKKDLLLTKLLDECLEYAIRNETLNDLINQESESLFVSFYTKNIEWMGEQEWRFSIPLINTNSNLIDFNFAKSIYLGENIEELWKQQLIEIAKEQNLKVFQRKLNKTKSNWDYEEINIKEIKNIIKI